MVVVVIVIKVEVKIVEVESRSHAHCCWLLVSSAAEPIASVCLHVEGGYALYKRWKKLEKKNYVFNITFVSLILVAHNFAGLSSGRFSLYSFAK